MNENTIQELRGRLRGELITPADPTYEAARKVYNGMIDLSFAKTPSGGQMVDLSALIRRQARFMIGTLLLLLRLSTYAWNYARDHLESSQNHPPPANDETKNPSASPRLTEGFRFAGELKRQEL